MVPVNLVGWSVFLFPACDLDLFAAGLVEDLTKGWIVVEIEREAAQDFVDGILAVVSYRGNLAAAEVLQHQAFEEIVDVGGGEGQIHVGVARDVPFTLEIADAAVEQHDLADRQRAIGKLDFAAIVRVLSAGERCLPNDAGSQQAGADTVPNSHLRCMTPDLPEELS